MSDDRIETVEELDALPVGSVVEPFEHVAVWQRIADRPNAWIRVGSVTASTPPLPVTLRYNPSTPPVPQGDPMSDLDLTAAQESRRLYTWDGSDPSVIVALRSAFCAGAEYAAQQARIAALHDPSRPPVPAAGLRVTREAVDAAYWSTDEHVTMNDIPVALAALGVTVADGAS